MDLFLGNHEFNPASYGEYRMIDSVAESAAEYGCTYPYLLID